MSKPLSCIFLLGLASVYLLFGCGAATNTSPITPNVNFPVVVFSDLHFNPFYDPNLGDSPKAQAVRTPVGDNRDNNPHEVRISLMSIGLALLVSTDPVTIQQFTLALQELSISPDACKDAATAGLLLKRRKFDAVIVDLQIGEQSGMILDEVHLSSSNRTAVIFGISNSDAESTAAFRKKAHFSLRDLFHLNQSTKSSIPLMGLS